MASFTLFFMLHCGKPLYNSVLWANWGPGLSNVVILGNRFTSYRERFGLLFLCSQTLGPEKVSTKERCPLMGGKK